MQKIIGRKEEVKILDQLLHSGEAEFLAIYGRRRVGKTYLIQQYFSGKGAYLEVSGAKDKSLKQQLTNFTKALSLKFFQGAPIQIPSSWD